MSTTLVSVLIDTHNHEGFIEEAIRSVLEQDAMSDDIEILAVDDGSTDNTPALIKKFAPRVRYLRKANGGQASAFNLAIPEAHGEIVAFLDGDDWWAKDKLRSVLVAFEKHPDVGVVGHGILQTDENTRQVTQVLPERLYTLRLRSAEEAVLFTHLRCFLGTSRMSVRMPVLRRALPVPEALVIEADEFIFTICVAMSGAVILDRPLTYYRMHADNLFQYRRGDETRVRRRRDVNQCLVRELPPRLAAMGVPQEAVEAIVKPVWVDAERLRLSLGEGRPWNTFQVERTAYRLDYRDASLGYRFFKALVLASTLLVTPRRFYRLRDWYAANGLRRLRKVIGEPTPAAPIVEQRNGV